MKATRPLEVIYFAPVPFQTQKGTVFAFFAVDEYSEYAFNLGLVSVLDDQSICNHLKSLLNHPDFKTAGNPFTIVSAVGQRIEKEIKRLLAPNGSLIIDEKRAITQMVPVVNSFMEFMSKSGKPN
jgi:hypothetical protein